MLERITLRRTKGWKMPPNTVKVDRSTKWGNPFTISKGSKTSLGVTMPVWQIGTWSGPGMWFADTEADARQMSVSAYCGWLDFSDQSRLREDAISELRGKNLACWCKTGAWCHADVLMRLANA